MAEHRMSKQGLYYLGRGRHVHTYPSPRYDIHVYTVPFMKMIKSIAPFRKPLRLGRDCSRVSDD